MASKRARTRQQIEWVGGIYSVPAYITGDGEPYRPEMLVWMVAEGPVLGFVTGKPGELLPHAVLHFHKAMQEPMVGPPHAPARLRVGSQELVDVLRPALPPATSLVHAPTPELDDFVASLRERAFDDEHEPSYLSPGVGEDAVASFFRAAAGLFRASPWSVVPSDQDVLSVTIEQLDVRDAAVSVIGQMGESFGFILFENRAGFDAYLAAADAIEHGEEPRMPRHLSLNFEPGAEVDAALGREISRHDWEVAGARAFPWVAAIDEDLVARTPTARELSVIEAIALALPGVLARKDDLLAAFGGGKAFSRAVRVAAHAGELEVTVRAPLGPAAGRDRIPFDILADLAALDGDGEELDDDARDELEEELLDEFLESPEAEHLDGVGWCRQVLDYAAEYFGVTIASLRPHQLREILFEIFPRKVSVEASKAGAIIAENRALFAFLKRKFGFVQADACLRVLDDQAVRKLAAALSDRRNFGMAKSMFMAGRDAGFDIDTREGAEAWMREVERRPLPSGVSLPAGAGLARVDPETARARKNKRKAARRARKKNR